MGSSSVTFVRGSRLPFEFDHHAAPERLELDPFAGQVDLEHLGRGFGLLEVKPLRMR